MPFVKGVSGNPNGRPKGAAGIAAYVAEQTNDCRELVDRLLAISRNPGAPIREVAAATQALLDRAVGKPMQPQQLEVTDGTATVQRDYSAMPLEERRALLDRIRALPARVANPVTLPIATGSMIRQPPSTMHALPTGSQPIVDVDPCNYATTHASILDEE